MRLVYYSLFILCVIEVQSERTRGLCYGCQEGYTRIKRAKYYPSFPQRFFKRPSISYPIRSFPHIPSLGYMADDTEKLLQSFKPKVSKRPTFEGFGDEDIMKHLSKQELDKLIEFANEKEVDPPKYNKEALFERPNYFNNKPDFKKYEGRIVNKFTGDFDDNLQKFSLNGPYVSSQEDIRPYNNIEYNNPNENDFQDLKSFKLHDLETSGLFINKNKIQSSPQFETEEFPSFPNTFIQQSVYGNFNKSDGDIFTDSTIMQEEELPMPTNLRDVDHDVSYTNNVPSFVKADPETYKAEDFGALPLMNYHSKLATVDSYRVPHYTVTSPGKYGSPAPSSDIQVPPVEPAPPASTAQEQSDAHLKAIKIWTHRSKGTAYYLHDDGSLSLEKPSRPKTTYG